MELEELKNEISALAGDVSAIKNRLNEIATQTPPPKEEKTPTNDPDKNFVDYIKTTNIKER